MSYSEPRNIIAANINVKANVYPHLRTHLDDAECKLEVENVLLDYVVVDLVGTGGTTELYCAKQWCQSQCKASHKSTTETFLLHGVV